MPFDIETRLLQGVWGTDGIIAMLFLRLMSSLFVLPWNLRCDSLRAAIQGSLEKREWNYGLSIAVYSSEDQIQ